MSQQVCDLTIDEHLQIVQQSLPRGRIWNRTPDSTMSTYWRSFAETVKYLEDRACDLIEEYYCDTANETLDTWAKQYGIDAPIQIDPTDPCVKVGYTQEDIQSYYSSVLCSRVAAQGGGDCPYFTEVALALGWVVVCEDTSSEAHVVCGCWDDLGFTMLGPPAEYLGATNVGWEDLNPCEFGAAVEHPEPEVWRSGSSRQLVSCQVPGSELGIEVHGSEGQCFMVGFYEYSDTTDDVVGGVCAPSDTVDLDKDVTSTIILPTPPLDGSGQYREYTGHAHTMTMTINATDSMVLQQDRSPFEENFTVVGCFACGDTCAPLNGYADSKFRAFMEDIIPAHVQIRWEIA